MRESVKNAIVFFGACVVSLGGMEISLRMFGGEVLAMGNQFLFYQFDKRLGWSNIPNADGYFARAEYRIHVHINSLGMRDREPRPDSEMLRRIAVLGDSFVWGVGAEYGERFTEVMERDLPQVDVLNYGVSGYGTTQELVQLETVLDRKPGYVILALCLSNDVMETVNPFRDGYNKPFAKWDKAGQIEIVGYPLINVKAMGTKLVGADSSIRLLAVLNLLWRKLTVPNPAVKNPRFRSDFSINDSRLYARDDELTAEQRRQKYAAFDIDADVVAEMNRRVEQRLGPRHFLVAFVPTKFELPSTGHQANEVGDQLLVRLRARGIEVLDPRGSFSAEDFWRGDGHWNARGHQVFAKALEKVISTNLSAR
jgi:lysophospholipase L1-like esterase